MAASSRPWVRATCLVLLPALCAAGNDCVPSEPSSGPIKEMRVRVKTWHSHKNMQMSEPTTPEFMSANDYAVLSGREVNGAPDGIILKFAGANLCLADTIFEHDNRGDVHDCYKTCVPPGQYIHIRKSEIQSGSIEPTPPGAPPCCLETNYNYHYIFVEDPNPTTTTTGPPLTCYTGRTDETDVSEWRTEQCAPNQRCFQILAQREEGNKPGYITGCENNLKYEDTDRRHRAGYGASCSDPEGIASAAVQVAHFATASRSQQRSLAVAGKVVAPKALPPQSSPQG